MNISSGKTNNLPEGRITILMTFLKLGHQKTLFYFLPKVLASYVLYLFFFFYAKLLLKKEKKKTIQLHI